MWWRASFAHSLTLICLTFSEKRVLRTDDGHLRHNRTSSESDLQS